MRSLAWLVLCSVSLGCDKAAPQVETSPSSDAGLPAAEFTTAEDFESDAVAEFKDVTPEQLGDAVGRLEAELQ